MTRKNQSLLLLVLSVVLLVIISVRVSPKAAEAEDPDAPHEIVVIMPDDTPPPMETPAETPEPPKSIGELFPSVSRNDWNLRLVNQTVVLPSSFAPDVTKTRNEQYVDSRIIEPLEAMLTAAEAEGYTVCLRTAYRPYATQAYLFNGKASQIQWGTTMSLAEAETEARKVIAYPGTSEHQTGLSVDILDSSSTAMTADTAKNLPLIQWLTEHCTEFGFVARYPEHKQDITGWNEPWHFRYVGPELAAYMAEQDLCLEELISRF